MNGIFDRGDIDILPEYLCEEAEDRWVLKENGWKVVGGGGGPGG